MRSKCHSSLTFTVCCLNASLCVGAAQQQQRAAQWVRSCKALAPSLHHLSISTRLIFALPLSVFTPSTLTPGVFIRWVGALSTVSLQLILTVLLLSPPPPSWHLVQIWRVPFQGVLLLQDPLLPHHDVSFLSENTQHRLGLWPQSFFLSKLSFLFSLLLSLYFLLAWLTMSGFHWSWSAFNLERCLFLIPPSHLLPTPWLTMECLHTFGLKTQSLPPPLTLHARVFVCLMAHGSLLPCNYSEWQLL